MAKKIKYFLVILLFATSACKLNPSQEVVTPLPIKISSKYTKYVQEATSLMNKRRFKEALKQLDLAIKEEPKEPEAYFRYGLSLFRMERYVEAGESFQKVIAVAPDYYQAYEWSWITALELNKSDEQSRNLVRSEIETVLREKSDQPGFLFTAYLGYKYLNEPNKGQGLLKNAVGKVKEEDLKSETATFLLEEMFAEADNQKRISLAELYVTGFPRGRNFDLACRLLFQSVAEQKGSDSLLHEYIDKYATSGNAYLNRTIAAWLIKKNWDLERAISLLEANLLLVNKPEFQEKPKFMTYGDWENIVNNFNSECLFLLGEVYFKKQEYQVAKSFFRQAGNLCKDNPNLYYYLGEIARMDNRFEEATTFFRRALELGGDGGKAEKPLRELLKSLNNYEGKPNEYFARNEGVVTFYPVTEQVGLGQIKAQRINWADYDNDGWPDFVLDGPRLYKNLNGKGFKEITNEAGLDKFTGFKEGVWGDYNRDGYVDLFLVSPEGNRLLMNNGHGGFVDVTEKVRIDGSAQFTEAAAWGDMDNDGFLDLYLANYERPGVINGLGVQDKLLRNKGNGTFEDISKKAGIITDEPMCGRGVVWGDINQDGRQDILVSNYRLDPNFLWINQGNNTFVDMAEAKGVRGVEVEDGYGNSIASVLGDLDNDGDVDIFTANLAHPRYIEFSNKSMLLLNSGAPDYQFKNTFSRSGICFEESNAIPILGDIDNDGDLDLFVTAIWPGRYCHLYLNAGRGQFREISWLAGVQVQNAWGCAYVDYDKDGDLDLAVATADGLLLFNNRKIEGK